mmetsp:Transcript_29705/g.64327  ORF Transcript_29705/g.64327 Transcript_29705/m.64327 type:complete len:222 (-) Transcript_29705:238-903(-)
MKMNQRKESANRRFVVPETTTEQPLSPLGGAILSRSQRPTPATPADSTPKPPPQQQKKRHDVLPSATDNPQPPSIPDRKPSPYDDDKESEDAETTMCSWFSAPLRLRVKKCNNDVGNVVPAAAPFAGMALAIGHASSWLGGAFAGLGVVVGHSLWLQQDTNTNLRIYENDLESLHRSLRTARDSMKETTQEIRRARNRWDEYTSSLLEEVRQKQAELKEHV